MTTKRYREEKVHKIGSKGFQTKTAK